MRLGQAVVHLKHGGLVIYPTETAYGLGADPRKPKVVARIFSLKGRASSKTLPLIAASIRDVLRVARMSKSATTFARKYWPGPLTLVLPVRRNSSLTEAVVRGGMIAVRVSSDPIARALARGLGGLIISTSANRSGAPPCYSVRAVCRQFGELLKDVLIVDGGALPRRKPSMIMRVEGRQVKVIRA